MGLPNTMGINGAILSHKMAVLRESNGLQPFKWTFSMITFSLQALRWYHQIQPNKNTRAKTTKTINPTNIGTAWYEPQIITFSNAEFAL